MTRLLIQAFTEEGLLYRLQNEAVVSVVFILNPLVLMFVVWIGIMPN